LVLYSDGVDSVSKKSSFSQKKSNQSENHQDFQNLPGIAETIFFTGYDKPDQDQKHGNIDGVNDDMAEYRVIPVTGDGIKG
jgi:hypothetical protein